MIKRLLPPAHDLIDADLIEQYRSLAQPGQEDPMCDVIVEFLGTAPESIERVRRSLDAGDATRAARAVHTLKGSCANFGARAIVTVCDQMMTALEGGSTAEAGPLFDELCRDVDELSRLLRAEMDTRRDAAPALAAGAEG